VSQVRILPGAQRLTCCFTAACVRGRACRGADLAADEL